jgi:hypothetical protein
MKAQQMQTVHISGAMHDVHNKLTSVLVILLYTLPN